MTERSFNRMIAAGMAIMVLALCFNCASATKASYATIGLTVHTVDTAMQIYADAVVAGKITAEQEAAVRAAHDKYRATAHNLQVVLETTNANPTPPQIAAAASSVITLIEQFTGRKLQ